MFKKCQIISLPSRDKAGLVYNPTTRKIQYVDFEKSRDYYIQAGFECLNLYIIAVDSHERIRTNDWYFDTEERTLDYLRVAELSLYSDRLVIATTENIKVITEYEIEGNQSISLPCIPKDFIETYVNEFNNGSVLTEVLVEYLQMFSNTACAEEHNEELFQVNLIDKAVNVRRYKVSWSRAEVIEVIKNVLTATGKEITAEMINIPTSPYIEFSGEDLDKWIEENL